VQELQPANNVELYTIVRAIAAATAVKIQCGDTRYPTVSNPTRLWSDDKNRTSDVKSPQCIEMQPFFERIRDFDHILLP